MRATGHAESGFGRGTNASGKAAEGRRSPGRWRAGRWSPQSAKRLGLRQPSGALGRGAWPKIFGSTRGRGGNRVGGRETRSGHKNNGGSNGRQHYPPHEKPPPYFQPLVRSRRHRGLAGGRKLICTSRNQFSSGHAAG